MDTLKAREDFEQVFSDGDAVRDRLFVVYALDSSEPGVRMGMVVSRRLGRAVERNRVRRLIREVMRLHEENVKSGVRLVVIARRQARELARRAPGYWKAEKSLVKLMKRLGVYEQESGI